MFLVYLWLLFTFSSALGKRTKQCEGFPQRDPDQIVWGNVLKHSICMQKGKIKSFVPPTPASNAVVIPLCPHLRGQPSHFCDLALCTQCPFLQPHNLLDPLSHAILVSFHILAGLALLPNKEMHPPYLNCSVLQMNRSTTVGLVKKVRDLIKFLTQVIRQNLGAQTLH